MGRVQRGGSLCGAREIEIISTTHKAQPSGFQKFKLHENVQRGIDAAGYIDPRPIQAKSIESVLEGRDVLGLAQTGTGKTAAFVLPILQRCVMTKGQGPRALVVAPTRELALQIHGEFEALGQFTNVRSTVIFGGVGQNQQVRALARSPQVIVACPGRLLDLHKQRHVDFSRIEVLVLDEADHMFDMGFLPDIRRILKALPQRRQNLLFSATMPREIRGLADSILNKPKVVELAHSSPADTIAHALYPVKEDQKQAALEQLLSDPDFTSAIVFLRTKHRAKRMAIKLSAQGREAVALQGNMSQNQREKAMSGFRSRKFKILVATDIAARGIDVADVSHVINFDVPNTPDAYVHRIGRTGRSEQQGKACTLITRDDQQQVRAIERRLGRTIDRLKIEGVTTQGNLRKGPARPLALDEGKEIRKPKRPNAERSPTTPQRTKPSPLRDGRKPSGGSRPGQSQRSSGGRYSEQRSSDQGSGSQRSGGQSSGGQSSGGGQYSSGPRTAAQYSGGQDSGGQRSSGDRPIGSDRPFGEGINDDARRAKAKKNNRKKKEGERVKARAKRTPSDSGSASDSSNASGPGARRRRSNQRRND